MRRNNAPGIIKGARGAEVEDAVKLLPGPPADIIPAFPALILMTIFFVIIYKAERKKEMHKNDKVPKKPMPRADAVSNLKSPPPSFPSIAGTIVIRAAAIAPARPDTTTL